MKYPAFLRIRGYATRRRGKLNALSLDHVRFPPRDVYSLSKTQAPRERTALTRTAKFLQRARVLSFYRTILRGTRQIQDPRTKSETRKFVRDEFERHRSVTDISHIRYLLSTGKTEWESMERYIGGM
ncbi:LYR motif-containing protein 2 [Metarhizium anisopliae]|nr:LYR motif-containing protein 2 [Metarhizium anisopliae]